MQPRKAASQYRPRVLPELPHARVEGRAERYAVTAQASGGNAARSAKFFSAESDDTPHARGVRFHELLHVRLSPADPEEALKRVRKAKRPSMLSLLAVEDARIQRWAHEYVAEERNPLKHMGVNPEVLRTVHGLCDEVERGTPGAVVMLARYYVAGFWASPEQQMAKRQVLEERGFERLATACERQVSAKLRCTDFGTTVQVAKWLDDLEPPKATTRKGQANDGEVTGADWGRMAVVTPPLPVMSKALRLRLRPSARGTVLRFPSRILTGEALGRRAMQTGASGTVLVDVSGSMGITEAEVQEFVERCPAGTLAVYAGSRHLDDGPGGHLIIVAHKGRRVAEVPSAGGENIIDGPALAWLGKQPGPRVWVSDGKASKGDGQCTAQAAVEAEVLCRRIGARRVRYMREALASFGVREERR